MLKYNYWRSPSSPPCRDWVHEPSFSLEEAFYGGHGVARFVAESYFWLWGSSAPEYSLIGGQAWPYTPTPPPSAPPPERAQWRWR